MFLLNEILWFLPLVLYAGYRVWRLIPRPWLRFPFLAFFICLVLGFPLAETLSHGSTPDWTRPIMMAGYYALPLLLYFVMVVVPADLVVGLLWLIQIPPRQVIRGPKFRAVRLGVYLLLPVLIVLGGVINYRYVRVKTFAVEIPRKSAAVTGLKIVFASDFHLGERTAPHFMEGFVNKVNAQKADIVLIGGDVLEADRRREDLERFESQFRRIQAKYGVFAVPGNHEGYGGGRSDFFARAGIRLLVDEVAKVDEAFYLAGRKDGRSRGRKSIAALLGDTPHDLPLVVLDHRPTDLDNISRSGADIQLSGHTHHGQLFPVNFITRHRYELDWGYKKKGRTHVFVSSGVQLWGPPVRTVGASEILVVNVTLTGAK